MITDIILFLLWGLIYAITSPLRLLADVVLESDIADAIATANSYIQAMSFILPVSTLVAVIGTILIVETSIFSYKIVMWLIRKIPTIN